MATNYIHICYEEVEKVVMGSSDNDNVRFENSDANTGR